MVLSEGSGTAAPSEVCVRECFVQSCNNARAFMELRFKHFGTYAVIAGLLATAVFREETPTRIRASVASLAICLTILFALLDYRTSQYLFTELEVSRSLQRRLGMPHDATPHRRIVLRASTATGLIFAVFLALWIIALVHCRST